MSSTGPTSNESPKSPDQFRDRLSMIGEGGHREKIYPAEVTGFWRKHRSWTQAVLILYFLILPWTRINGEQTVLLDLPARRFALFGLVFQAHDGPLIFFILGTLAVGLTFVTAVWGRVWCGWACPQTVFLDGIFRRVEKFFEGGHLERRKLDREEMSFRKFRIKTLKWIAFAVISLFITHSFLAYFVGARNLIDMVTSDPAQNWASFLFILISTGIILFDFGWFREQFCIVMCPYGRFQSVMMDTQTVTVTYDVKRGEPRKGAVKAPEQKTGDCVNCGRCVAVCPTGIDIRNGAQMECIGCTACIDACDEIMTKVKKPTGLIRYDSLRTRVPWYRRPRAAAYAAVLTFMIVGLTTAIVIRKDFSAQLLRGLEAPYTSVTGPAGEALVLNHLRLHLHSQVGRDLRMNLKLPEALTEKGFTLRIAQSTIELPAQAHVETHAFITAPAEIFRGVGRAELELEITPEDASIPAQRVKGNLLGPY